jgi:glycosyltransferase involved in cell wall biosynthesis
MAGSRLGGAERSMLSLIKSSGPGLRFTLVLPQAGELEHIAVDAGARVKVLPWAPRLLDLGERSGVPGPTALVGAVPALERAVTRLRALVASLNPDILVTSGIKPHVIGALALRAFRDLPLVWYLRESMDGRRVSRAILRVVSGRCDAAVAVSHYVAENAATYLPRAISPQVVYNIVSVPFQTERFDEPIEKPAGETWFAIIGALTAIKGHQVFLEAAAIVSRSRSDARFLIVGSNHYATERRTNYERELRAQVHELDLDRVVRFLGYRHDIASLLRQIDVVVQSNIGPEGFGRSVAEAMAAGVPVIASRGWSLCELIRDDDTGWLVPPGDPVALATRMLSAATDPQRSREVGVRGQAFLASTIQPSACAADFEQILIHACGGDRRARPQ